MEKAAAIAGTGVVTVAVLGLWYYMYHIHSKPDTVEHPLTTKPKCERNQSTDQSTLTSNSNASGCRESRERGTTHDTTKECGSRSGSRLTRNAISPISPVTATFTEDHTLSMLQSELYGQLRKKSDIVTANNLNRIKHIICEQIGIQVNTDFNKSESLDTMLSSIMTNRWTLDVRTLLDVADAITDLVDLTDIQADIEELKKEIMLFDFEVDIVLLHTDADREEAKYFTTHFAEISDLCALSITVRLFEEVSLSGSVLQGVYDVFDHARLICVLVTENLTKDGLTRYLKDICLSETLTEDIKRGRLVPVWYVPKGKSKVRELNPISGLRYNYFLEDRTDAIYISSVTNLINNARNTIRKSKTILPLL